MKMAARGKFDPYLSLLDYRNTPSDVSSSLAQRSYSGVTAEERATCYHWHASSLNLWQCPPQDVQKRLIASRQNQAYYYNLKGKALPELQPGQIFRMKKPNENILIEVVCKKMIGPRSYDVVSGNGSYRRNRRQLRLVAPTDQAVSSRVSSK